VGEQALLQRLRIPKAFEGAWLGDLSPIQKQAVEGMCRSPFPGKPIMVLSGNVGTGKTHAACVALREFAVRHQRYGQFWPVVDLLARYHAANDPNRATESPSTIDAEIRRARLLVIDDFGRHKGTEYAEQQMYRIINQRWSERVPLIVTTNLAPEEFDDALASRLFGKESAVYHFSGGDRRQPVHKR